MTYISSSRLAKEIPPAKSEPPGNYDPGLGSDQNGNGYDRIRKMYSLSRCTSNSSISGEELIQDCLSDELDKLSTALSEVSSEGNNESSTSFISDMVQAQLALWTCAFSLLYLYAWMQHRKKFLLSIFIVVPVTFTLTCLMSWLLGIIVIIGRIFSSPVDYKHYLDFSRHEGLHFDRDFVREQFRQRSYSGASSVSCQDGVEGLPRPLCRRHSSSLASLCSRPPSVNRKLSYAYSHYNSYDDNN